MGVTPERIDDLEINAEDGAPQASSPGVAVDRTAGPDGAPATPGSARRAGYRSGVMVTVIGVGATGIVYAWIAQLQARGKSPAALAMADMGMNDMGKYWSFPILQASGLVGLVCAYLGVMLGLQQSGRAMPWIPLTYRQVDRLHRQISLLVLGLVGVHVLATVLDAMGDSWRTVLIPGEWAHLGWAQAVWGYDTGIFALYLVVLLAPTYYARRRIGPSRWRFLHRFVLAFYALSVWHALILGLDIAHYAWIRPTIWLAQIPLLALFARRLAQPARHGTTVPPQLRGAATFGRYLLVAAAAVGILAALIIVATGHSDLITTV
jgi:Ferric reductase like transmembrane component